MRNLDSSEIDEIQNPSNEIDTFREMISQGDIEGALEISENLLESYRGPESRDYELEAWIRMERSLIGGIKAEDIGKELRWCADRFAAISPGSSLHALALLNLGSWHRNNGEKMMALVTLSDISTDAGHPRDITSLSRLESGRILSEMGDYEPGMRHLWIAMEGFIESNLNEETMACGIEWLDLALESVEENAPRMAKRILDAKPREEPGKNPISSSPEDVRKVIEIIIPGVFNDLSGEFRTDLGLIIDAGEIIGESSWKEVLASRIEEIQDPRVIDVLQS